MKSYFSFIVCFLIIFSVSPGSAQDIYLCVWRNPERTMTRIFPDARDYKTVNVRITPAQRKTIEEIVGYELLPGQQDQFQYFEMTDEKGQVIGTIIPSTQKGQFGAVEFVFGLDADLVVRDLYIQRARERDQSFKDRSFLDLFAGRSIREKMGFDQLYTGEPTPGTTAVITGLIKAMVAFETLVATDADL
jgi:hypothetical protein